MIWCAVVFIHVCVCVNSCHFFFLRTEYGFSERREPKWFYLFIYSVYTSVVFFLFYIYTYFFFYFHSIVNVFASLLLSYWRNKMKKKTAMCVPMMITAHMLFWLSLFQYINSQCKSFCYLFWSMFDVILYVCA